MTNALVIDTGFHWAAVLIYVIAAVMNTYGLIFNKERAERLSYIMVLAGLLVHGTGLLYRWHIAGHGPYMVRYEVLSSNAWIALFFFLLFSRVFPKIRPASIVVFPAGFLTIAIAVFLNPAVRKLPPTLKSIWLVLHVTFYKIALGTILIALAFSLFYILKKRTTGEWLKRLPDQESIDIYAYRFAGFGFVFWAIGMLAGSIWAFQSWGRFWGWDPVETWSLVTWILFGIYLHLRRFFRWGGEKAAYLFIGCFVVALLAAFFTPLIASSVHSEYFR